MKFVTLTPNGENAVVYAYDTMRWAVICKCGRGPVNTCVALFHSKFDANDFIAKMRASVASDYEVWEVVEIQQ